MKVAFATLFIVGATLTSAIAIADPNAQPEAKLGRAKGFCGPAGSPCARDAAPEPIAEPEPEARLGRAKGFCGPAGSPCARDVATCGIPGNPCSRLKRSADAVAEALAIAEPRIRKAKGFCGPVGSPCAKARRSIIEVGESVEEAITNIYAREADAEARLRGAKGFCGPAGSPCARDAAPEPEARIRKAKGFCGPVGSPCAKRVRRDAEAVAEPEAKLGGAKGFCGPAGSPCARSAAPEAEARIRKAKGFCGPAGSPCARSAAPEAEARIRKAKGFCGVVGSPCAKVKRDAEANAEAEARIRKAKGFCGPVGSPCARSIEEDSIVARALVSEEGEATALRAAHAAFMAVKREAEEISEEATPFELLAFCVDHDCSEDDVKTIAARALGTFDERDAEACNAVGGACEIAKRQLDEIEAKLTAAVEAL